MKTVLFATLAVLVVVVGFALLFDKLTTGNTQRVQKRLKCLLSQRGKAAGLFAFVVLWYAYPFLADQLTDDGQRPVLMDVGVFQTIILAAIRALVIYSVTKLFLKHEMPVVHNFFTRGRRFMRDFIALNPWQKHLITTIYFLGFLLLFSQLTR